MSFRSFVDALVELLCYKPSSAEKGRPFDANGYEPYKMTVPYFFLAVTKSIGGRGKRLIQKG